MNPHPGSPALQDTTVCRQGRAQPCELRCTPRGWGTSSTHSGALRCLVWANCGMFLEESRGFPSHHVQAAPGGFPAWTCIPAPRDPFYLPRQHLQGPIYTKLQLSEALSKPNKTKLQKSLSTKWKRQKMCSLGRERWQRAALHFPAAIRITYLCEWWWLHENTSAEPSDDSSDVNRGKKQTESVQSTEAAMGHGGGDARL